MMQKVAHSISKKRYISKAVIVILIVYSDNRLVSALFSNQPEPKGQVNNTKSCVVIWK